MKSFVQRFIFLLISSYMSLSVSYGQQLEVSHWHFGANIGLFHNGNVLEVTESSISTMNGVTPATIANENGELMLYTNGSEVRNGNHDVIENGTFANTGLSNVFVPEPGNPDRYYLFRSAEWGVNYSVIDMTLNGGAGGILEDQNQIIIGTYGSKLMVAGKANSVNFWLIIADNQGGFGGQVFLRTHEVTDDGVSLSSTFSASYTWASYFNTLDDAKLSPDCSKIATLHKGHYLTLFMFDNETGEVYNALPSTVNTYTSFTNRCNLDFSPNGEYVYAIGDFYKIDRFSLETWTPAAIGNSQTTVATLSFQSHWRDIKLGPYGDVYILNSNTNTIDRIIDPDVTGAGEGVEPGEIEVTITNNNLFPNTPNLGCTLFSQAVLSAANFCLGDTTILSFELVTETENITWDFGSVNITAGNVNVNPTWVIYDEPGTYTVLLDIYYFDTWHSHTIEVIISEQPEIDLGEDIVLCEGESVQLEAPNNETYSIMWSTGSEEAIIEVSTAGLYSVNVDNFGCAASDSVVVEVIPEIPLQLEDVVQCNDLEPIILDVTNSAAEAYNWNTGESTGSIEVSETGVYWVQMTNSCFDVTDTVSIHMIQIPDVLLPDDFTLCESETAELTVNYTEGEITWSTGATGPSITVSQTGVYSVAIDHLGCTAFAEVEVDYTPGVDVNLDDVVLCEGDAVTLNASHPSATTYLWSNGSTESEITVNTGGNYWVEVSNSCFAERDTATVQLVVFPTPLLPQPGAVCLGDSVFLAPQFTNGTIVWNTGENSLGIVVTESGYYNVSIDYLGCTASDEVWVEFQDYYDLNALEMPNVFTPNGDAYNREFRPFIPDNPGWMLCQSTWLDASVTIYNRWGKEIQKDICAWDGTGEEGQTMHDGTYFYLVDLRASCYNRTENRRIAGHVSLLR